ncbi:MAG: helix-turn-helix domain-containing protein [Spirochaetaceae bacterium]|jgi:transcriptional regulator with XRE-family HTH domain|nr:helix-turn-helix domain-containing protein [Spirochaetaceae bacterium]
MVNQVNIGDVFSINLKKFRLARRWSQAELAIKTDVSTHYIGFLENATRFPSFDMIQRLASALDIDPTELFRKEINPEESMKNAQKIAYNDVNKALTDFISTKLQELS